MTPKRSQDEINADIIISTMQPITKSAIRLQQGMSTQTVERYLLHLTRMGFIESTEDNKIIATGLGLRYLDQIGETSVDWDTEAQDDPRFQR